VKWTEPFRANGHNMTKKEIGSHGDVDAALDCTSKVLDSYKHELAHREETGLGIQDPETYIIKVIGILMQVLVHSIFLIQLFSPD